MANLVESNIWEAGIYQLETADPVLGGPNGIDNLQAKQLASRTNYLNANKAPLASPALTGAPTAPTAAAGTNTTQLATTAFVAALGVLKAPLASPALTGVPTAPTPAAGTNTTQVATAAFVQAAVAALVNASPSTLDTLNELAVALGNDPNFATTITAALGLKAPLASPALTGVPTAPTAAAGTNTTQLATTAFVAALGALKANLASPALTGVPTAPTPAAGTNTTQIATAAFVQAAVAALVDASPVTLDTLNELAAALGDDPNFATTITTALGLKAPLASPALTGIPTVPTAAPGTSTTQVASTAFVEAARVILAAADALKAPLASPALTGIPTAPTAALGTNTTQIATMAAVQAAVAALVASSPATLNTLNELAVALGNDPNFATTITTALGLKAPLASPALTGIPTVPTAVPGTSTTQVASTAFVEAARVILAAADALKAPLASPALTGIPTAPTPALGTNTTQIATMAAVQAAIAALVASSPSTLDTLNELAAALGDDPNFATTITTALGLKAPLASPALTGTPTAPTPAPSDNSTKLATTAFLKAAGFQYSGAGNILASRALVAADIGNVLMNNGTSTLTIGSPVSIGARSGDGFTVTNYGANNCTLAFSGSTYAYGSGGLTANISVLLGESITFIAESATSWRVINSTACMGNIGSFSASIAANGYQRLPSGLIVQWGAASASVAGSPVSFPIAFTANPYAITLGYSSASAPAYLSSSAVTATGFTFYKNTGLTDAHFWMAIGK